jgi:uncharacterized protein YciI
MTLHDLSSGDGQAVLYLLFLSLVPGKTLNPTVIEQHAAHLADLDREGRLVLAGPLPERLGGLIALRVANVAEAKAIAEVDPMIRGGFQTYELATWMMANKQNHYQPNVQALGES